MMWVLCSMAAIVSMHAFPELQLVQGVLLAVAHSCNLHSTLRGHSIISLAEVSLLQSSICSRFAHTRTSYPASDAVVVCADESCSRPER